MWLVSVSYLGALYLLAYVLEKPSGFGVLSYPPPSLSYSVGSLGNALFCGCTQAWWSPLLCNCPSCFWKALCSLDSPHPASQTGPTIQFRESEGRGRLWTPPLRSQPKRNPAAHRRKAPFLRGPVGWLPVRPTEKSWALGRRGVLGRLSPLSPGGATLSPGGLDFLGRPQVLALHVFAWGPVVKCYRFQQINADLSKRSPAAGPERCLTALCLCKITWPSDCPIPRKGHIATSWSP